MVTYLDDAVSLSSQLSTVLCPFFTAPVPRQPVVLAPENGRKHPVSCSTVAATALAWRDGTLRGRLQPGTGVMMEAWRMRCPLSRTESSPNQKVTRCLLVDEGFHVEPAFPDRGIPGAQGRPHLGGGRGRDVAATGRGASCVPSTFIVSRPRGRRHRLQGQEEFSLACLSFVIANEPLTYGKDDDTVFLRLYKRRVADVKR